MPVELTLPKLGMTMESARILEWRKNDGARVEQNEVVLTIETDKVVYEVAAPASGIIRRLAMPEEEVPVGAIVALITANETEYQASTAAKAVSSGPVKANPELSPGSESQAARGMQPSAAREKIRIAPAARRLAEEKGIDLRRLRGSGPEGRITREDVMNYEDKAAEPRSPAADSAAVVQARESRDAEIRTIVIKHSEQRRIVARKMMEAVREAAQTTQSNDVDATELCAYRNTLLPFAEKQAGVKVTITDIMMKLVACALKKHPILNSMYTDDADIVFRDIHMGMAMSLREGELLVPVIRDIDKKSVIEIATMRADLLDRGRSRRLTADDIKGSTFTFSALGMYRLERFVALINRPENAILAAGVILEKPWVHNGQIAIRKIMNLTLTYDHRTIYGAEAAQFMATLKSIVESPMSKLNKEGAEPG